MFSKRKKNAKGHPNGWGDEKRVEVVTTYLAVGTAPLTFAVTGVPVNTIRQWRLLPWWKELEDQIRQEDDAQVDVKLKRIVDKSLDIVMDRIENGDIILQKDGSVSRRPINIGLAHKVSTEMLSKRDLIRKRQVNPVDQQSIEDHLANIATELAKFHTQPKLVEGVTIDGTATVA